jgi:hypothetical protein
MFPVNCTSLSELTSATAVLFVPYLLQRGTLQVTPASGIAFDTLFSLGSYLHSRNLTRPFHHHGMRRPWHDVCPCQFVGA